MLKKPNVRKISALLTNPFVAFKSKIIQVLDKAHLLGRVLKALNQDSYYYKNF